MKLRARSAVLCMALIFALSGQATAVESPSVLVNGAAVSMSTAPVVINGTTYVPYLPVVQAVYPDAVATWENDQAVVRAEGLTISIQLCNCYLVANGRYLYFAGGVIVQNGDIMVPVRTLAQALGASVSWSESTIILQSGAGPILSGDQFYEANTLYWLSHIINAESGNQPMSGKIAVGNVVMNRVGSPVFPNNVHDVVFQRNQFTPVQNGSINLTPNPQSVIAAKLCLDGANTAGNSLYFVNYHYTSWASRNRPYVQTIGDHAFYA